MKYAAVVLAILVSAVPCTARTIYVDADAPGANDGSSWEDAYNYLQDALADADSPTKPIEIRVAQGIYRPDERTTHPAGTGRREATFQLLTGVTLKGGYAGVGNPNPDARDTALYETILSGDLNGDDDGFINNGENSYHVVYSTEGENTNETAVLDGFTITAGNADGQSYMRDYGGGMYNSYVAPTVIDCRFIGNWARRRGGGMHNLGIWRLEGGPRITGCTFSNNYSDGGGGGMYNKEISPIITGCTFSNNYAATDGGGIYSHHEGCILSNCIIADNFAGRNGGGIIGFNFYTVDLTMTNCIIVGNEAGESGGGMMSDSGGNIYLTNSILWDNIAYEGPQVALIYSHSIAAFNYCCVQGGELDIYTGSWSEAVWGPGNIDADPCLVDPDANDYHLRSDSPCINAGDLNFVAGPNDVDMDGEHRVMLGRVDMGADEFNPFQVQFVVVEKRRIERTVFQYECEIILVNVSRFSVQEVRLEMTRTPANMTIIEANVDFGEAAIGPGQWVMVRDTCTFTVDRTKKIDAAQIVWQSTCELAGTGAPVHHTILSTFVPPIDDWGADFAGLSAFAGRWLWTGPAGQIQEDIVPDGKVNLTDFARFADDWMK